MLQILLEIDSIVEYLALKSENQTEKFTSEIRKIVKTALVEPKLDNEAPMTYGVSTEFRRISKLRKRTDVFEKFLYENNNQDGKEPADLKNLVNIIKNECIQDTISIFKFIIEKLHSECA